LIGDDLLTGEPPTLDDVRSATITLDDLASADMSELHETIERRAIALEADVVAAERDLANAEARLRRATRW
jgi:hypothetical protein